MISISKMSGAGSGSYYLSLATEEYYVNGGEPPGRWFGRGAERLQLEGKVENKPFRNLLRGYSPDGSVKLVRNAGHARAQSGWDVVFTPPKSLSVLWAMAPLNERRQIQAAINAAVKESLTTLQDRYLYTRRGDQGKQRERADLVVALFNHGSSRSLDPNPHTHALVLSRSPRADGTTGTIISKLIYDHKRELDRVFSDSLVRFLRKDLRLTVRTTPNGFDIEGVSQTACALFSKRRAQILERLNDLGLDSAQAARVAAFDTRSKKVVLPRGELFERWHAEGRAIGFGPEQARELFARAKRLDENKPKPSASLPVDQRQPVLKAIAVEHPEKEIPKPAPGIEQKKALPILRKPDPKQRVPQRKQVQPSKPVKVIAVSTPTRQQPAKEQPKAVPIQTPPSNLSGRGSTTPAPVAKVSPDRSLINPKLKASPIQNAREAVREPGRNLPNDPAGPLVRIFAQFRKWFPLTPKVVTPNWKLHVFGQALIRIPFTKLEFRSTQRQLFRNAPAWSPLSQLKRITIAREKLPLRYRAKALDDAKSIFRLGSLSIEVRRSLLSPYAKQWSPLYGVQVKHLQIARRPTFAQIQALREKLGLAVMRKPDPAKPLQREYSR